MGQTQGVESKTFPPPSPPPCHQTMSLSSRLNSISQEQEQQQLGSDKKEHEECVLDQNSSLQQSNQLPKNGASIASTKDEAVPPGSLIAVSSSSALSSSDIDVLRMDSNLTISNRVSMGPDKDYVDLNPKFDQNSVSRRKLMKDTTCITNSIDSTNEIQVKKRLREPKQNTSESNARKTARPTRRTKNSLKEDSNSSRQLTLLEKNDAAASSKIVIDTEDSTDEAVHDDSAETSAETTITPNDLLIFDDGYENDFIPATKHEYKSVLINFGLHFNTNLDGAPPLANDKNEQTAKNLLYMQASRHFIDMLTTRGGRLVVVKSIVINNNNTSSTGKKKSDIGMNNGCIPPRFDIDRTSAATTVRATPRGFEVTTYHILSYDEAVQRVANDLTKFYSENDPKVSQSNQATTREAMAGTVSSSSLEISPRVTTKQRSITKPNSHQLKRKNPPPLKDPSIRSCETSDNILCVQKLNKGDRNQQLLHQKKTNGRSTSQSLVKHRTVPLSSELKDGVDVPVTTNVKSPKIQLTLDKGGRRAHVSFLRRLLLNVLRLLVSGESPVKAALALDNPIKFPSSRNRKVGRSVAAPVNTEVSNFDVSTHPVSSAHAVAQSSLKKNPEHNIVSEANESLYSVDEVLSQPVSLVNAAEVLPRSETDRERKMRLLLRHRYLAAANSNISLFEFSIKLLECWECAELIKMVVDLQECYDLKQEARRKSDEHKRDQGSKSKKTKPSRFVTISIKSNLARTENTNEESIRQTTNAELAIVDPIDCDPTEGNTGPWTLDEKTIFLKEWETSGLNWCKLQKLIPTRSRTQISSFGRSILRKAKLNKDDTPNEVIREMLKKPPSNNTSTTTKKKFNTDPINGNQELLLPTMSSEHDSLTVRANNVSQELSNEDFDQQTMTLLALGANPIEIDDSLEYWTDATTGFAALTDDHNENRFDNTVGTGDTSHLVNITNSTVAICSNDARFSNNQGNEVSISSFVASNEFDTPAPPSTDMSFEFVSSNLEMIDEPRSQFSPISTGTSLNSDENVSGAITSLLALGVPRTNGNSSITSN